ncbi:sigma-54 dependent transcriptional regulator [Lentimicrobium sp.]|jgi:DNA-binding NtrC family response regulator|uniref:sigma-54-dependent transcriptional regulator n=5 Tax=Lentimicrobium sp. TaxID=2034841 RepID=UPI002B7B803D|nr:sigma-54 dependent transcriptional regulator [Lentimicrobium sp.]MCO5262597.1 sigma-54 dependent transcriptional regulator [Lentimicrobium sp.]HOP12526.1 sigma-54 dependent transcriptional regulator [Lentimicrobium sp.]HPJ62727.1 sigma-54 dependent transcriptional regulator [Lentimicrobium sp.]HPR26437.1 sigma-54 dependent transcriptional regulator [Lentimicrobium sp.]
MSKIDAKILIVDDDQDVLLAARLFLKQHFSIVHTEKNPENIPAIMKNESYDLILLDMNFSRDATSGKEGFHWLNKIIEIDPLAVVIFITGYGDIELAVQGIKEGATNFILKPWDNKKLLATITANLKVRHNKEEIEDLKSKQKVLIANQDQAYGNLIGQSPAMQKVMATVEKVAKTEANVLILGENGTGKELIARAIHKASSRHNEVFISVDLGAISETLFESELFGFKKGAFTDAKEDRAGRFEAANKGTVFLDEIGNLSFNLQSKLLSVLQNRKVVRLGTNREIPIDVRLICATNMPLYQMVNENKFRQDLLYRINTVEILLPPLRERLEDIQQLVEHFLVIYCKKYKMPLKRINPTTIRRLEKHSWPGNIRELQHAVERAVILSESNILQPQDFFLSQIEDGGQSDESDDITNLEEREKLLIRRVIDKHGGNISKAAKELGLTRASLYRRIEKHGL